MSSGIDIELVRENYRKMSDQDLIRQLTQDARGLTVEAQEVVAEEVRKRNLDQNIIKGVEAQQKDFTTEELDEYCSIIQSFPCPVTGSTEEKLNGTFTSEVISFIFFSVYRKRLVIACPDVLDSAVNMALLKTCLLGWWGLPWGIIRTIQAISVNIKSKRTNRLGTPNDHLRTFVWNNIGLIETYKDNRQNLYRILFP